jgi:hypothetical protein
VVADCIFRAVAVVGVAAGVVVAVNVVAAVVAAGEVVEDSQKTL